MREFLEEAHEHMQDGFGRAQKAMKPQLPKRFYKAVEVLEKESEFVIALDGRAIKTPSHKPISLRSEKVANLVCAEWVAQNEEIDAATMPHTRLINAAFEGGDESSAAIRTEIVNYVGNDLVLFRADSPQELVAAQNTSWDAVLALFADKFDAKFEPIVGIIHRDQPQESLDKMAELVADLDQLSLTALMSITNLTGSGLLALSVLHELQDADDVWAAAHVDEDHNIRLWGQDEEAANRRAKRKVEFDAAVNVLRANR